MVPGHVASPSIGPRRRTAARPREAYVDGFRLVHLHRCRMRRTAPSARSLTFHGVGWPGDTGSTSLPAQVGAVPIQPGQQGTGETRLGPPARGADVAA